jgi:hypothetical protein
VSVRSAFFVQISHLLLNLLLLVLNLLLELLLELLLKLLLELLLLDLKLLSCVDVRSILGVDWASGLVVWDNVTIYGCWRVSVIFCLLADLREVGSWGLYYLTIVRI